jgi:hypothetical protein
LASETPRDGASGRTLTFWMGLALAILGGFGAAWSAGKLTRGIWEIPQHWWSSLATVPAIVGVLLLVASRR